MSGLLLAAMAAVPTGPNRTLCKINHLNRAPCAKHVIVCHWRCTHPSGTRWDAQDRQPELIDRFFDIIGTDSKQRCCYI